jgi:hypothetical protein
MIFTRNQIEEILQIIDFNTSYMIAFHAGTDTLLDSDKLLLESYGIKLDEFPEFAQVAQSFYFGRLTGQLSKLQSKQIEYSDFKTYLSRGQFIPLSKREKETLDYVQNTTYDNIKNLGDTQKKVINGIIMNEDAKRQVIKEEIDKGAADKRSVQNIASEIRQKTGDFDKNWTRLVETTMNDAFQQGRSKAMVGKDETEEDVNVYKEVFENACRHCIRLYLTNGIGSKPRVFKLSNLIANGNNYGKKVKDWVATLGSIHPHCRCLLRKVAKGKIWDEEIGDFVYPKREGEEKIGVKITVGTKVFER